MTNPVWKPTSPALPKTSIDPRSIDRVYQVLTFGILLDDSVSKVGLPRLINAVTRDLLNLLSSASPGTRIRLISPSISILKDCLSSVLDVDFLSTSDYASCKLWKAYWIDRKPSPPSGVVINFSNRVTNTDEGGGSKLSPGRELQLPAYDIPKPAPPGYSPMTIQSPPRTNAPSQVPNLYPWLG